MHGNCVQLSWHSKETSAWSPVSIQQAQEHHQSWTVGATSHHLSRPKISHSSHFASPPMSGHKDLVIIPATHEDLEFAVCVKNRPVDLCSIHSSRVHRLREHVRRVFRRFCRFRKRKESVRLLVSKELHPHVTRLAEADTSSRLPSPWRCRLLCVS